MTDSTTLIPLNQNKDKTSPSPNNTNNTNTKFPSPSASLSPSPKQNKINHKKRQRETKNSKNEPPQKKRKFNGKLSDKIGKIIDQNKALKQNNKLLKTEHAKKEKLLLQQNKILTRQKKELQEQNDKYASVFNQAMNFTNIKNINNKIEQFSLIELAHKYKERINRNKMANLVCYECKGNNMNDMNNKLLICSFCNNINGIVHINCGNNNKYYNNNITYWACTICRQEMKKKYYNECKQLMEQNKKYKCNDINIKNSKKMNKNNVNNKEECVNNNNKNKNKIICSDKEKMNALISMGFNTDKIKNIMNKYPGENADYYAEQLLKSNIKSIKSNKENEIMVNGGNMKMKSKTRNKKIKNSHKKRKNSTEKKVNVNRKNG